MKIRTSVLVATAATASLLLTGCSTAESPADSSAEGSGPAADGVLPLAAAFYPLQFVAERVGGDQVSVLPLTAPGVEPHDLELSPSVVRELQDAELVLYLSEFQPAVDDAVETTGVRAFDAHHIVEEHEAAHEDEAHDDEEEEAHEEDDDGHDHSAGDPHFWLDPALLAEYAHEVSVELSGVDPDNAEAYAANAEELETELLALDQSFTDALSQCERSDIFVSHEAFGFLTERFGLEQHGLSGLDPDAEPSPARVREVRDEVQATGATTVYSESLVDAAAIEALAADAGVQTAVLDPVEGVSGDDDYIDVMTRNLDALRAGLGCN
ncbi:metal ABC transporter substrate-binding protein [Demequina muriae]|uniref:Metal ABC transporter substrate-binding protein n=1 Tax=Demequina muriae TaxID=3051664 RepID=A0ABT8GJ44_9MICO|nr:metal ABC transporter substrate-binding protein [Demequina sp. EGI L300058]MDN4481447.1 metal ABC transporter substrate-binding protein [Demequina sp. EGI L300058]